MSRRIFAPVAIAGITTAMRAASTTSLGVKVYDRATGGVQLTDIATVATGDNPGDGYPNGVIQVGIDGLIPNFVGPDEISTVYFDYLGAVSRTSLTADRSTGQGDGPITTATFAQLATPARYAPGLLWGFAGDSITNGSTASNSTYSYPYQALMMAGGLIGRADSIEAGVGGERVDQLLARVPTLLSTGAINGLVMMIGTNDASQAVSVSTYAGYVTQIIALAKARGIPVILCTVPPRGSGASASIHQLTRAYNAWIKLFGPTYGAEIADTNAALVDTTSGYLAAANDAGDGVHPNDLGHQKLAVEVAKAMKRVTARTTPYGVVTAISAGAGALIADPLNARATVISGSWSELAGGTGTAPTYSMVTDTSGVLPAGRWAEMDFDAVTAGVRRLISPTISTGFAVGDRLMLCAHLQIEDVSGSWQADVVGSVNNTHCAFMVMNQTPATISGPIVNCGGILSSTAGVYDIGPVAHAWTVPAGVTSMYVQMQAKCGVGKHIKYRLGAVQLINLTTLGLNSIVTWGSTMVAIP